MKGSIRDSDVFATYSFITTPATNATAEPHKTEFEVEFFKTMADKNTKRITGLNNHMYSWTY